MAAVPRARRWMMAQPFAHRGLHGAGIPENSMSAFRAARRQGLGVECDVRLSADDVPFVFHDRRLARLTGRPGRFADVASDEARRLPLLDGDETVPQLADVLALARDTVPILVEIKSDRFSPVRLCKAVARCLDVHRGPVAVMSFDPRVLAWFAARRRHLPRGMVLSSRNHPPAHAARRNALAIARSRPHFLARDVRDCPLHPVGTPILPTLCWTVRSGADRLRARRAGAQIIFERR